MKGMQMMPTTGVDRAQRGFTLIELMIVVAVVAILASIALPAYNDSVRKSRRGQAKADLVEYAQLAERWFTVNNTYATFVLPTNQSPREAGSAARYTLNLVSAATTFTITAVPQGGQAADSCGTLTMNQAGAKTPATQECW
ncbi:type IV pilin protein [Lysobacter koreensis]|uniref:Type IV pilin protein n=1 Tax=Lysobacter koreensis TaxID=266122 RepID=A0ABW2YNP2_9GAMM